MRATLALPHIAARALVYSGTAQNQQLYLFLEPFLFSPNFRKQKDINT